MFLVTTAKTYLDYSLATVLQNRIRKHAVKFTTDPLIFTCLIIYLIGLLKDKSLSYIKVIDDMHNLTSHEHEHLYFHRLRFMRDNDIFNWEA